MEYPAKGTMVAPLATCRSWSAVRSSGAESEAVMEACLFELLCLCKVSARKVWWKRGEVLKVGELGIVT